MTGTPREHISHIRRALSRCDEICRERRLYERALPAAFLIGTLLALICWGLISAPRGLAIPAVIKIKPNTTLEQVASQLKEEHVIRSARTFEVLVRLMGGNKSVQAGSYFFASSENLITVAVRFRNGDFELNPKHVSIPETATVQEITDILSSTLIPFDRQGFLDAASSSEGYFYPDTYFFYPGQDPEEVVRAMKQNFQIHITEASTTVAKSAHSLHDLITMASILIGEARSDHDRRIVAGILWKRIALGMPLQVDAPFGYIYNKKLTELTSQDLKIDSPYNTYSNKGLPPTPIGSPAIDAILDAAQPIKTSYLYYISDASGVMHYSATFAGHEAQIREYLK